MRNKWKKTHTHTNTYITLRSQTYNLKISVSSKNKAFMRERERERERERDDLHKQSSHDSEDGARMLPCVAHLTLQSRDGAIRGPGGAMAPPRFSKFFFSIYIIYYF